MTAGPVEALQVFQQREIALQFLNVIAVPHRRWFVDLDGAAVGGVPARPQIMQQATSPRELQAIADFISARSRIGLPSIGFDPVMLASASRVLEP
jgi:hypothetical protein